MTFQDWLGVGTTLAVFTAALGLIGWTFYLVLRN